MTRDEVMASGHASGVHDVRGRRRLIVVGVVAMCVSPVAWIGSLGLSYVVQDFACTAAASADADPPTQTLLVTLIAMNVALLMIVAASGVVGGVIAHRSVARRRKTPDGAGEETGVEIFLGCAAVVSALLFAFGIILIAANPLVFEVCS